MAYIGNKPANKAVVASDLDPAVITGQTALAVAPADTDEFLISDAGVLKRLDASLIGGGGLIKLASTTISSAVAAVAFDNTVITSTYDNYKLICTGLTAASDNQDIGMRMSVDNGSNFATHVGGWNYTQIDSASSDQTGSAGNKNYIPFGSDEEADADGFLIQSTYSKKKPLAFWPKTGAPPMSQNRGDTKICPPPIIWVSLPN